jgi:hypothetical protein
VAGSSKLRDRVGPSLDPESASSSLRGLRVDGLVMLLRPAVIGGEELAAVLPVTSGSPSYNA